jgi:hypothetical protein
VINDDDFGFTITSEKGRTEKERVVLVVVVAVAKPVFILVSVWLVFEYGERLFLLLMSTTDLVMCV